MVMQYPPWRHDSELAMIRDWFYPHHAQPDGFSLPFDDMRQRAVDRVNLWLFKAGQLPPAVLSTAGLTEALIHDDLCKTGRTISPQALQSIYSMAFARFVNAFVDRDVARSRAAELALSDIDGEISLSTASKGESSMYAHAATIGMPEAFVDLRHRVTHAEVPGLAHLRKMTADALEWLWERWWVKNATGDATRAIRDLAERKRMILQAQATRQFGEKMETDTISEELHHQFLAQEASPKPPKSPTLNLANPAYNMNQKRKRGLVDE